MISSTTLNFNAVGPIDDKIWRPIDDGAVPGLRTVFNRGQWLSPYYIANGYSYDPVLAEAWVDKSLAQNLIPFAFLIGNPNEGLNFKQFATHCRMVASQFLGRVRHYEIGNEFDTNGWWLCEGLTGGTSMGQAWRIGTDVIRSVDPSAIVVCGSAQSIWPTGHGYQTMASAFRSFGPSLPEDLSIHVYPTQELVPFVPAAIERFRGACAAHAKGTPRIWVTEWNLEGHQFSKLSEKEQGVFLRTMHRNFINANVHAAMHYFFERGDGNGFVDSKRGKKIWNDSQYAVFGKA